MAQTGKVTVVSSVAATQLQAGCAQHAALFLSLDLAAYGLGGRVDSVIRSIGVLSKEGLIWELWFFRTSAQNPTDLDLDRAYGKYLFAAAGTQIAAAGTFHAYADGLQIPYQDEANTGMLFLALINRSAAAKTAGAAGQVRVQVGLESTLGW